MTESEKNLLREIILLEDIKKKIIAIESITKPAYLHIIAYHYNWDDGFDIPRKILNHPQCDFGTALMIFYRGDGYGYLTSVTGGEQWIQFITECFKTISSDWPLAGISYEPELTNLQKMKLKKSVTNLPEKLLQRSPGKEIELSID